MGIIFSSPNKKTSKTNLPIKKLNVHSSKIKPSSIINHRNMDSIRGKDSSYSNYSNSISNQLNNNFLFEQANYLATIPSADHRKHHASLPATDYSTISSTVVEHHHHHSSPSQSIDYSSSFTPAAEHHHHG